MKNKSPSSIKPSASGSNVVIKSLHLHCPFHPYSSSKYASFSSDAIIYDPHIEELRLGSRSAAGRDSDFRESWTNAFSTLFTTIDVAVAAGTQLTPKEKEGIAAKYRTSPLFTDNQKLPYYCKDILQQTQRKVLQTTEINWMKNNPSNGTMNYLDRCIIAFHCEACEIEL